MGRCANPGPRESKYLTGLVIPMDGGSSAKSFIESLDLGHDEIFADQSHGGS